MTAKVVENESKCPCSLHRGLTEADVCDGVYQLVFHIPEALLSNETWRDTIPSPVYQENLVAVVIDENDQS